MSSSNENSLRAHLQGCALSAMFFLTLLSGHLSADECGSIGLVTYTDYFVGEASVTNYGTTGSARSGAIGITECGHFIVGFEGADDSSDSGTLCESPIAANTGSGIFARRFLPNGTTYSGDPMLLTTASLAIHSSEFSQVFYDPSLSITRDGQVLVTFIGHAPSGKVKVSCSCPQPSGCSCLAASEGKLLLQTDFPLDTPPAPIGLPASLWDFRTHREPSNGISGIGAVTNAWSVQDACDESNACHTAIEAPTGWFWGEDAADRHTIRDCDMCIGSPSEICAFADNFDPQPCGGFKGDAARFRAIILSFLGAAMPLTQTARSACVIIGGL